MSDPSYEQIEMMSTMTLNSCKNTKVRLWTMNLTELDDPQFKQTTNKLFDSNASYWQIEMSNRYHNVHYDVKILEEC